MSAEQPIAAAPRAEWSRADTMLLSILVKLGCSDREIATAMNLQECVVQVAMEKYSGHLWPGQDYARVRAARRAPRPAGS